MREIDIERDREIMRKILIEERISTIKINFKS